MTSYSVSGGSFSSPYWTFGPSTPNSLVAGSTYTFTAGGIASNHPFRMGTVYGDESASWIARTGAMSGSDGSITVAVPADYTGTVTSWCSVHGTSMDRTLTVTGGVAATSPPPSPPPPSPPSAAPPPYTTPIASPPPPPSGGGLGTGAVLGIVAGVVAVAAAVGVGVAVSTGTFGTAAVASSSSYGGLPALTM